MMDICCCTREEWILAIALLIQNGIQFEAYTPGQCTRGCYLIKCTGAY